MPSAASSDNAMLPLMVTDTAKTNSATGTRTQVARVKAEYPSQLDYSGAANRNCEMSLKRINAGIAIKRADTPHSEAHADSSIEHKQRVAHASAALTGNKQAQSYRSHTHSSRASVAVHLICLPAVRSRKHVLEVGWGRGSVSMALMTLRI